MGALADILGKIDDPAVVFKPLFTHFRQQADLGVGLQIVFHQIQKLWVVFADGNAAA